MRKSDFEEAIRLVGELVRETDVIVFGSQAIHGLTNRPPKHCVVSAEVDVYPKHHFQAVPLIVSRLGRRSTFAVKSKYYVDCVSPELATLPDGWTERLVPFRTRNTGGVTAWCLEIHDLAISKLAAERPKDISYVRALVKAKLLKEGILSNRIEETSTTESSRRSLHERVGELFARRKVSAANKGRRS